MIIANGYIEQCLTTGGSLAIGQELTTIDGQLVTMAGSGGLDDDGYPVAAATAYGERIPCQVVPVKINRMARDNGERITAEAYDLYVDWLDFKGDVRVLRLTWEGHDLGEFSVTSIEPLSAVQELKISISHAD
jgi:hypothetical protein